MKKENICNNSNIAFGKVIEAFFRTTGQYSQYKGEYNAKTFYSKNCIVLNQSLLLIYTGH